MEYLRRGWLRAALGVAASCPLLSGSRVHAGRVPSNYDELEPFTREFNRYIALLSRGQLGLDQWFNRVVPEWDRMTK